MNNSKVFKKILRDIKCDWTEMSPRDKKVTEVINYTAIFNPINLAFDFDNRKFSWKYLAAELLWYISWDLNTTDISKYAKLRWEISDDYWDVNSNYWNIVFKKHLEHYYNQYSFIIETFKKDKHTRQALMRYNSHEHVYPNNKDFVCFPSSTLIHSPEWNITIWKLHKKFESWKLSKYPVYSFNESTYETEIKWCKNTFYNGKWRLLKITLDNWSSFKCTPNHKILIKSCSKNTKNKKIERIRKRADELVEWDIPQKIKYIKWLSNEILKKSDLHNHYDNRVYIHREYYEFLNPEEDISKKDIHHIDLNRYNNSENNLLACNRKQHRALHQVQNNANNKVHNYNKDALDIRIENYKSNKQIDYIEENNKFTKITKIEKLHRKNHDLFDIEVEDNHNFFINWWVCVHNCTISNQFMIRDNKIHMIVNMRSNDVFYWLQYDLVWFGLILQSIRLDLLKFYPDLELWNIYHNAANIHIYESMYDKARYILRETGEKEYKIELKHSLLHIWTSNIPLHTLRDELKNTKDYKWFIEKNFNINITNEE